MKRKIVAVAAATLILSAVGTVGLCDEKCQTLDRALGFATYSALDAFLTAIKAPGGKSAKSLVKTLIEKKQAFILPGGQDVDIIEEQPGDDPATAKLRVRRAKDKRVFWVPRGALDCK